MDKAFEFNQLTMNLGLTVNEETIQKIEKYVSLLKKWNSRINLIASNEIKLIQSHLQEGLWASKVYPENATFHLDIGSGAGFPAIPLGIMIPRMQIDMIDSRLKRIMFLETVIHELKVENAWAHHSRLDQFLKRNRKVWDCISWKAIRLKNSEISSLLEHAHSHTQFWIFHGNELAVEDPEWMKHRFRIIREEKFPYRDEWMLTAFIPA